ncbi:MAG: hypothetical protein RIF33_14605 [Cyclobacteriaceae bacterium]
MKILIFGASGAGSTTLSKAVCETSGFKHLDVDDYYWKPTHPPYQEKVTLSERNDALTADFHRYENVTVSGSLVSWGKQWESAFDLAVFIYLQPEVRLQRLVIREQQRYGDRLQTDQKTKQTSIDFLEWAEQYDDPDFTGRSLTIHNQWIESLTFPVLKLDGDMELMQKAEAVLQAINTALSN